MVTPVEARYPSGVMRIPRPRLAWLRGRTLTLRTYLVLLAVATVTPLALFALLLVVSQAKTESAGRERALRGTAQALALAVDDHLRGTTGSLEVLAKSRATDIAHDPAGFARWTASVVPTHEGWRLLMVLTAQGRLIAASGSVAEAERLASQSDPLLRLIRTTRASAISPAVGAGGDLRFIAGAPVGADGVQSVVAVALDTSGLQRILRSHAVPEQWTAVLVDQAGQVVAREGPTVALDWSHDLVDRAATAGWMRTVGGDATPWYLAFHRAPNSWWGIAIAVPAVALDAPFWRSIVVVIGVGLLCLVAGVSVAAALGRKLARPLMALVTAASQIERGERPAIDREAMVEEVSQVARGLQSAAVAIEERAVARFEAEVATRESQAWFAALAAFAPIGIIRFDPSGYPTYVNDRWTEITGLTLDQARNEAWGDRLHPDDRNPVLAHWPRTLMSGQESYVEFRFRDPRTDGLGYKWLGAYARPVTDGSGRIVEYIIVAIDISERKRIEAERAALAAQAEAANRAKDEFLAALSHELRTPLNALLLWVEVLREGPPDATAYGRAVEAIDRSARQQAKLVEDILDIARISSGKFTIDPRPIDLVAVVRAAVETVRDLTERKGIEMTTDLAIPSGWLLGDPQRLQQVVLNLLSNAVRFTPAGGRIEVIVRQRDNTLCLQVQDTGEGIAPEFMPHIFERFRQADSGASRRHGGLGLGLAIARDIVELHGGQITVASEGKGRGAVFAVTLPIGAPAPVDERRALPAPAVPVAAAHSQPLADVRMLLVEDDDESRDLLVRALRQLGAQVMAAASARQALELLRYVRPDVLVSDIGMVDMDGYQFIRHVRGSESSGGVPAVALTGYGSAADRDRALAAGYQAHMPKPVDTRRLAELVRELVKRSAAAGPAASSP
jgi:PAS domain S-box-containing protein